MATLQLGQTRALEVLDAGTLGPGMGSGALGLGGVRPELSPQLGHVAAGGSPRSNPQYAQEAIGPHGDGTSEYTLWPARR